MKSGLHFLIAARQCEIGDLEQLARTSTLVGLISQLVHKLQRERGLSNLFLGSRGTRCAPALMEQVQECERAADQLRAHFDGLDTEGPAARNGARLFSRIACVLQALDALPALRREVSALAVSPLDSTNAFVRLVNGLLQVVFDAADAATDPDISRALVALFNFMQAKEFAGQERAFGGICFSQGPPNSASARHWAGLIEAQERCFRTALALSDAQVQTGWQAALGPAGEAELERLRRIGCTLHDRAQSDPGLAQAWYDCCTARIDGMRTVEEQLTAQLPVRCAARIAQARAELRDHEAVRDALQHLASAQSPTPGYGPHLERSILSLVQQQAHRLQEMQEELDAVRAALNERKVIERAKGLLMAARQLSEAEAHKMLRQAAMNQNRRLLDVAQSVLALSGKL